jgi:hypothetical protein
MRKPAPAPRIADALSKVVVREQGADAHIFIRDHGILPHQGQRRLVLKVLALATHRQVRLGERLDGFLAAAGGWVAAPVPAFRRATRRWPRRVARRRDASAVR